LDSDGSGSLFFCRLFLQLKKESTENNMMNTVFIESS
jgi:hypothetical protein